MQRDVLGEREGGEQRRGAAGDGGDDEEQRLGTSGRGDEEEVLVDGRAGESNGSFEAAREGEPPATGGEGVERLEGVDGLCETRFGRGGKSKIWEIKIEQVNF